jgi:hypothetical protein
MKSKLAVMSKIHCVLSGLTVNETEYNSKEYDNIVFYLFLCFLPLF